MDTPITEYFQTKLAGPGMRGAVAGLGAGAGGLYAAQQWQMPHHGAFGDLRNEAVNRSVIAPSTGQGAFGGVPLDKMPPGGQGGISVHVPDADAVTPDAVPFSPPSVMDFMRQSQVPHSPGLSEFMQ